MKRALTALFGAAGMLAACTENPPPQPVAAAAPMAATPAADVGPAHTGSGCFYTRDIVGHQIADDHTLYIRTRDNAVYRLDMSGACLAGHSSEDPLIIKEPPGVQYVCRAVDMDISIGNAGFGEGRFQTPCIVGTMTRLTPAQVAGLPPKVRP